MSFDEDCPQRKKDEGKQMRTTILYDMSEGWGEAKGSAVTDRVQIELKNK